MNKISLTRILPSLSWKPPTRTICDKFSFWDWDPGFAPDFVTICQESCNLRRPAFHQQTFPPERSYINILIKDIGKLQFILF